MSRDDALRVLCYDVSDDRRRRKIARLLEERTSRVQYSVFEARLSVNALSALVARVKEVLKAGDSLRVYTIARPGERQCQVYGDGPPVEAEGGILAVVKGDEGRICLRT